MKTRIISLFFLIGVFSFFSCNNNEERLETRNNLLRITTDIATRSVIESTSFNNGDQIGVFAFDANSTNVHATYGNKWDLESDISLTETPTPIYAYYPYTTDCDYQTFKVDIAPDAIVTGQADYLYGKSVEDVSATSPEALIRFNHALARITLSIKRSADDAGYGVLSNVCLQNTGSNTVILTSGWMDVTTGVISSTNAGSISFDMNYTLSNETAQNVDILVIPTAMEKEGMAELILTIDGSQYTVNMPADTWEAGQQYTYPITINRKDAHIYIPEVGGKVGVAIDLGLSVKWASWNVGASAPEEYGGLYGWADPTGTKNSNNYDDYPSANPPRTICGTKYDIAYVQWGENWRLPTSSDLSELRSRCTWTLTTLNNIVGCNVEGPNGNSIFLPVAGVRNGITISVRDVLGYYWSGVLNSNKNKNAYGLRVDISTGKVGIIDYDECTRSHGLSIRPVKE